MLINLVPDFLAVLEAEDRFSAYLEYFERHRELLTAYWDNYVLEPSGPHFEEVVRNTVAADRSDLMALLANADVVSLARQTEDKVRMLLDVDVPYDIVLMVGVGAANAGELVVNGRGIAFVCLEHFTGVANPDTQGLGLDPELIPLWLSHEITHVIRYTSPASRSSMRDLVLDAGGYYSYWETGRQAPLRELLVNEGLAVQVSRAVSPGHAAWEYFGFARRQYARIREIEPILARAAGRDFERAGLGLRLRYLSGGMSDEARSVDRVVLPERAGYFLGARMVEAAIKERGFTWSVRANAQEIATAGEPIAERPRLTVVS
ncbi:MAG: hypothetical protein EBV77_04000 [Gemmatimonadaceae bacterium]|uniref:hypothetical protein n=1 Tax=Gemmatimonas sp. TaxID=1962908 RepID=UPI001D5F7B37|nr:hypothetical protein [Gemmatimonas sp.]NCW44643.1 hypothetical protein [Gemmatimonadaceae bacterium]